MSKRLVVLAFIAIILSIIATPAAFVDTINIAVQNSRTNVQTPDQNRSNSAKLSVRSDDASNKSWIKFDLGDLDVSRLKTATLTVTLHLGKTDTRNFDVSYVNDDCLDNIDWDESSITWNNAPGNKTDDLTGLDPAKTTLLPTVNFADGVPGDSFTMDVLEFLEADTGGIVQLVIHNSNSLLDFATYDHPTEAWRPFISVTEGTKAKAMKPYPANGTTDMF